jgi:hypothetical protein
LSTDGSKSGQLSQYSSIRKLIIFVLLYISNTRRCFPILRT